MGKKVFYRICWFFMVAPLVLGIADFLLWYIFRWRFLEEVGICIIMGGMISVVLGLIFLFIDMKVQLAGGMAKGRVLRRGIFPVGVLFFDFITAGGLLALAIHVMSQNTIIIHNQSSSPVNEILIHGWGTRRYVGTLLPRETTRVNVEIHGEGGVRFYAEQNQKKLHGELGYFSPPCGRTTTLTILDEGKFNVQRQP